MEIHINIPKGKSTNNFCLMYVILYLVIKIVATVIQNEEKNRSQSIDSHNYLYYYCGQQILLTV